MSKSVLMDLSTMRFGRLQPLALEHIRTTPSGSRKRFWRCRCDCGTDVVVWAGNLRTGKANSCGCLRRELVAAKNRSHGMSQTPEYKTWGGIKKRCFNSSYKSYADYGGRGITMCDRWLNSFENFLEDMGTKPSPDHSIERIDNDGHYEPSNCRWATRRDQAHNNRRNVHLTVDGITKPLSEWCREYAISHSSVLERLAKGWDTKRAVTHPPRRN